MNYLVSRLIEPSTYAGVAGMLIFGTGDITAWLNLAGMLVSALAMVLKEGS